MISLHEALIYAMVTASASDRTVAQVEVAKIGSIVQRLPVFAGFDGDIGQIADACVGHLSEDDDGLDRILDLIAEALPAKLQETAYALAVDVVAADLAAHQEELVFLQMMEDRFHLDKLTVAAIERAARVRFRTA
ncbi:tellurite resistance TerB family protein [Methylobrevis albus]|uniref:Tellurite resistance TerB family protein n=1 Tax=Methylobrevis albus TaxID=2793297 RepID=A0A931MW74_9HYPH|nr:tellurite resistance TerB family protein [Methylobrevis albus]MBH0236258.1 tellurite resistance TerB family protein [Methylobrevis albus]